MSRDDDLIPITLTRAQWRRIKTEIGEMADTYTDVLWDALDVIDLGQVGDGER